MLADDERRPDEARRNRVAGAAEGDGGVRVDRATFRDRGRIGRRRVVAPFFLPSSSVLQRGTGVPRAFVLML